MSTLFLVALLMGARHALDADHVAAVASLATRSSTIRGTVETASMWGLGHVVVLFGFGALVVGIDLSVPIGVAGVFEFLVGLMLVWLGIDVIRRVRAKKIHVHVHGHGRGVRHVHAHAHSAESEPHDHDHEHPERLLPRAFLVGGTHGLAGSAAIVLASLQATRSPVESLLVLVVYGVGCVLGMVAFSVAIFVPLRLSSGRFVWRGFEAVLGTTTVVLGVWIALRAAGF